MGRGGKRKGAGRPKGAASRRTREIADRAAAEGLTPLEVMLKAMRAHAVKDEWDQAAAIAKDAAPYIHPRLQAVQHSGPNGGPIETKDVSDSRDSLERKLARLVAGIGAPSVPAKPH